MPSLPRISSAAATPRLALQDPNAPVREAAAITGAFNALGGGIERVASAYQADKVQSQERQAGLQMSRAMTRFEEQFGGRDEYSVDEVPESIQMRRMDKVTDETGQVMEVPRESVPAYEVAPEMFRKFAMNFAESAAVGIEDDAAKSEFMARAEQQINSQYVNRLGQSRDQQQDFIAKQLSADINEAVSNGSFGVASELANEISDPAARQQTKQAIAVATENSYYDGLLLEGSNDPEMIPAMRSAVEELRDTDTPMAISNAQRLAKANNMEAAITRANAAAIEQDDRAKQLAVSMAWTEIDAGNPTIDEYYVQDLFDRNMIDGPERTRMIKAVTNARDKAAMQQATVIDLDRIAKAGYGIDPKDKGARKAVDQRFEQYVSGSGDIMGSGRQIMREFKVVPSPIASMFRSANRADAPNLAEAAALLIDAQEYAPEALADFKEGDIGYIEKIAANMQLGMDVPSAVETVRSYDALSPTQRSTLRQAAATMGTANAEALGNMISDHPSYDKPWSIFDLEAPAFMAGEFDSLVQKNLPVVGFNTQAAQRMAFNTLTRKWNMTDVNGDYEIMKYPPQAPAEQVRSLVATEYSSHLLQYTEAYGKQFREEDIKLRSDSLTEIQIRQGKKPTYMAYIVTDEETQTIERLPRFTFDPEAAAEARRQKILKEAQEFRPLAIEQEERIKRGEIGGLTL